MRQIINEVRGTIPNAARAKGFTSEELNALTFKARQAGASAKALFEAFTPAPTPAQFVIYPDGHDAKSAQELAEWQRGNLPNDKLIAGEFVIRDGRRWRVGAGGYVLIPDDESAGEYR